METVAAAWLLRQLAPDLRVRVVNVVDLMRLFPVEHHPHGTTEAQFVELFTADKPVIFAFHGYQRAIHESFMDTLTSTASMSMASTSRARPPRPSRWSC